MFDHFFFERRQSHLVQVIGNDADHAAEEYSRHGEHADDLAAIESREEFRHG